jgi:hypothetical protein
VVMLCSPFAQYAALENGTTTRVSPSNVRTALIW